MSRSLWIACVVAGLVVFCQDAQARGRGNKGPNGGGNNNTQQNRGQKQTTPPPTTQPFGSDTASSATNSDKKQLEKDQAALTTALRRLNEVSAKLKAGFETSPPRQAALNALRTAQADYAAQRVQVLAALQKNPQYKKAVSDRASAGSQLDSGGVPDSDRAQLASQRLQAGNSIAELETAALAADPKAAEAQRNAAEAEAKASAQAAQFQASFKTDPSWIAANQAIEKARAVVAADGKKLTNDMAQSKLPKDPNAI